VAAVGAPPPGGGGGAGAGPVPPGRGDRAEPSPESRKTGTPGARAVWGVGAAVADPAACQRVSGDPLPALGIRRGPPPTAGPAYSSAYGWQPVVHRHPGRASGRPRSAGANRRALGREGECRRSGPSGARESAADDRAAVGARKSRRPASPGGGQRSRGGVLRRGGGGRGRRDRGSHRGALRRAGTTGAVPTRAGAGGLARRDGGGTV